LQVAHAEKLNNVASSGAATFALSPQDAGCAAVDR
jgi:hypothetical protein